MPFTKTHDTKGDLCLTDFRFCDRPEMNSSKLLRLSLKLTKNSFLRPVYLKYSRGVDPDQINQQDQNSHCDHAVVLRRNKFKALFRWKFEHDRPVEPFADQFCVRHHDLIVIRRSNGLLERDTNCSSR